MNNSGIFDQTFASGYIANHAEMIEHWKQSTDVLKKGFAIMLCEVASGGVVSNDH